MEIAFLKVVGLKCDSMWLFDAIVSKQKHFWQIQLETNHQL